MINQVNQSNGEYQIGKNTQKVLQNTPTGRPIGTAEKGFQMLFPNAYKKALADNGEKLVGENVVSESELTKHEAELDQAKLWDREDALREHIEQREDTALQRWVADARRSGINPNLALGATGAASGGGITNASQKDYTLENTLLQGDIQKALDDLQRAFEKDENAKDRLNRIFSSFGLGAIMRIGK